MQHAKLPEFYFLSVIIHYTVHSHGRRQEFLQEGESLRPLFPLHPFSCLSILLLPSLPFPFFLALSTLPFLLCCQADPLNPARIPGGAVGSPSGVRGRALAAVAILSR